MAKRMEFTMNDNIYKGKVVPFPIEYKSLGELIWKSMEKYKNNIANIDAQTDKVITYAELQNKVVRCALWLQEQGIKDTDVVSLCSDNHLDSIVPCLAVTYVNAIFNTWNEDINLNMANHMLQLMTPKIIFCTKKSVDVILKATKNCNPIIVVYGDHPDTISFSKVLSGYSDAQVASFRYLELDDIKKTSCILHSSGTTGMPKGVELSNYSLLLDAQIKDSMNVSMVAMWFSSLYWLTGLLFSIRSIARGVKIIIYPRFDEEMICRLIQKYKIEWIFLSTSMTNRFLRSGCATKYSLPSLRSIFCSGAILKSKAQEELKRILPHVQILQIYGMTECGFITAQYSYQKVGSCGTMQPNVEIKIMDSDSGKTLNQNQTGEICVKTATVMNGYYRNPEATRNLFDKEGWLLSGDIGYVDKDGELYVVDRLKDLIKYKGYQISPVEIETFLRTHPGVIEAAVLGVPHPTDDEHPIAFVSTKPGSTVTKKELMDLVANNMMDTHKLRAGVVFLDTFPYTGSGKIAKIELKEIVKKLIKY